MFPLSNIINRDNAYLIVVSTSILLASLMQRIKKTTTRKILTSSTGFAIVLCFCGIETLHSLISVLIGTIIIKLCNKGFMQRLVFVFSFVYRIFFSLSGYIGLWRDEGNLANGIQLVLTIKMISVAYEIGEFRRKQSVKSTLVNGNGHVNDESTKDMVMNKHRSFGLTEEPTVFDIFCYMYCFLGIGTGPFFRYRTYHDMINMPEHISNGLPSVKLIRARLPIFIFLALISMFGGKYFNAHVMKSKYFYEEKSIIFRFFYVIPIGVIGMARYAVVWYLSEFGFIMAGLGVYPDSMIPEPGRGPTVFADENDKIWLEEKSEMIQYSYGSIRNVYIANGFTAKTYAKTFRWWNCTVQWWLAHFIYASKLFSGRPPFIRWVAVASVSAVWHGFKAGYYFSFLGMTYVAFAEHLLLSFVGSKINNIWVKSVFDIMHYLLFKAVGIGSFMTTFALSSYSDIMTYLSSVYYGIYSIATLAIIFSAIVNVTVVLKTTPKKVS